MTPPVNGSSALFLDIDGTLLDLARTPDAVVVPNELQRTLLRLHEDLRGALAMPLAERKSRHAALFATLLANDISKWGDRFLSNLMGTKHFDLTAAETRHWHRPASLAH